MVNESFAGIELMLKAKISTETVVCQIPGRSLHMRAEERRKAVDRIKQFRNLMQCRVQSYPAQVSQPLSCGHLHDMEMRLRAGYFLLMIG